MADKPSRPTKVGTTQGNAAGRVEFDSRGNSVWRWNAQDKGTDSTSILIKRLDNDALELEPTRNVRVRKLEPGKRAKRADELSLDADDQDVSGGFDPYNHR